MAKPTEKQPPHDSRGRRLLIGWRGDREQQDVCTLLKLDAPSYSRFEHGIRRPPAKVMFRIEELTDGAVPAKSWLEPPLERARARKAS